MPEFLQDFYEDHPNISKLVMGFVVAAVAFCSAFFPSLNQINDLKAEVAAEHETRVAAETVLGANIGINAELIVALDEAQQATQDELATHMAAYRLFVLSITDAVNDNTMDTATALAWIDNFNAVWADFQEQYEGDLANINATINSWRTYLYYLITT